jgi:hypothetical protein
VRPAPVRGGTLPRGSVREAGVHDADLGVHDAPIRLFTFPILVFTIIRSCCSRCADPGVHDRPKHAEDAELRLWREKNAAGRADVLRRLEEAQRDLWAAQRVDEAVRELDDASKRAEDLEGAARSHRETLQSIREAGSSNAQRLRELLTDVVASVLDGTAAAELVFELRDVFARVDFAGELGGVAGEALKTWAFDVAAMLAAAEGRTPLPALLIHDSPREGDLGLSHYHKYFRYVAGLEHRLGGTAFQYIVSTTTSPPDEIVGAGHVVLRLNGGTANDRLLRVNL